MNDILLHLDLRCPCNPGKGAGSEPGANTIAKHMALPISYRVCSRVCQYKILPGEVARETERCIRLFADKKEGDIAGLNVQFNHLHYQRTTLFEPVLKNHRYMIKILS
jgi:hypothetical protein